MTKRNAMISGLAVVAFAVGASVFSVAQETKPEATIEAKDPYSMFDGRDEEMARAMAVTLKTFQARRPYDHQINDGFVKSILTSLQFAKNNDMMAEFVQHDIDTLTPILERRGKELHETGNREIALDVISETGCFYQLVVDGYTRTPGQLKFVSPYKRVLQASSRIGQHDLTEKEIHEQWTIPRFKGFAAIMGVELDISEWDDSGEITVTLVPTS